MPDALNNNDKLLNRSALDRVPPEVSLIPTLLMDLNALRNILNETKGSLEGQPAMLFFRIHQFHGKYLLMVLTAVYKTSSIEEGVSGLEANVRDYVSSAEIRKAIADLEAANKIDALLKDVYRKKLEMIEFEVMVRVQDARSKAEGYIKQLHDAWKSVKDAGRLTYTGK